MRTSDTIQPSRDTALKVATEVASETGVPVEAIMGRAASRAPSRARMIVHARLLAVKSPCGRHRYSLSGIARVWGMDHSTISKNLLNHNLLGDA